MFFYIFEPSGACFAGGTYICEQSNYYNNPLPKQSKLKAFLLKVHITDVYVYNDFVVHIKIIDLLNSQYHCSVDKHTVHGMGYYWFVYLSKFIQNILNFLLTC